MKLIPFYVFGVVLIIQLAPISEQAKHWNKCIDNMLTREKRLAVDPQVRAVMVCNGISR